MCARPVSGDASEAEIGEDEVVVPVELPAAPVPEAEWGVATYRG